MAEHDHLGSFHNISQHPVETITHRVTQIQGYHGDTFKGAPGLLVPVCQDRSWLNLLTLYAQLQPQLRHIQVEETGAVQPCHHRLSHNRLARQQGAQVEANACLLQCRYATMPVAAQRMTGLPCTNMQGHQTFILMLQAHEAFCSPPADLRLEAFRAGRCQNRLLEQVTGWLVLLQRIQRAE